MLAEKQDNAADGQRGEQEVDAKVLGRYMRPQIVAREGGWNEAGGRNDRVQEQREGWDSKDLWKSIR